MDQIGGSGAEEEKGSTCVLSSSVIDPAPIYELCQGRNKICQGPLCPAGAYLLQETLGVADLINDVRVIYIKKQVWTY